MFLVVTYKPFTLFGKVMPHMYEPGQYFTTDSWDEAMKYMDDYGVSFQCELWTFDQTYRTWYRVRFQFNDRDTREFIQ